MERNTQAVNLSTFQPIGHSKSEVAQTSESRRTHGAQLLVLFLTLAVSYADGQSTPEQISRILEPQVQPPAVVEYQLKEYLMSHAMPLKVPVNAEGWTAESRRIRKHLIDDVVFRGWPKDWVNSPPHFEDRGLIPGGKGYRMRKLCFEIVPGFWSSAILYEPEDLHGKVPAILNVSGHIKEGKASEYEQKRSINYALRGMLVLYLEWLNMGELQNEQNDHGFGGHLELVGANAVGLFYFAMRRGLDYLCAHPSVDPSRIGMTGLSGGGWQTITLGSLDERVAIAVPVAGYDALATDAAHPLWVGVDIEWNASDFREGQDYTTLTAMRAPRPTLLIYNAEDDCCFRAPIVKPYIFDDVKPFYRLYGKEDVFEWHENVDPSTHNFQVDNRQQSYRFFTKHFGLPVTEHEIPVDAEIKSYEELAVGLPKGNLTILRLAREFASQIQRRPIPSEPGRRSDWRDKERASLKQVVRYKPVALKHPWAETNTKGKGIETLSYRFEFSNGLSATGVWLKAIATGENAPIIVALNDKGKRSEGSEVSDLVNRGEQVLATDLLFTGDSAPPDDSPQHGTPVYTQALAAIGERPLGMEAAELITLAQWLRSRSDAPKVRLMTSGIRSQVVGLIAAVIEPTLFSEVVVHEGMQSLGYLLEKPVIYEAAPDLFCLDLYKDFDLDTLALLAQPTSIVWEKAPRRPD